LDLRVLSLRAAKKLGKFKNFLAWGTLKELIYISKSIESQLFWKQIKDLLLKKWWPNPELEIIYPPAQGLYASVFFGVKPPGNRKARPECFERVNGSGVKNISFPKTGAL